MRSSIKNKVLAGVLAAIFAGGIPRCVPAAVKIPLAPIIYMTSNKNVCYGDLTVGGLLKSQSIAKSSIKSSDKSVAKVAALTKNGSQQIINVSKEFIANLGKSVSEDFYETSITLALLKPGITDISFKLGEKTYKTTLTVKPYENPISSIIIPGVNNNRDISSKLKNSSSATVKLKKNISNAKLKIKASKNWKISSAVIIKVAETKIDSNQVNNTHLPTGSMTINAGDLKKKNMNILVITVTSTKDDGNMEVSYLMN